MTIEIEHLESDFELVEYLQNMLVARSTGKSADDYDYQPIRKTLLDNPNHKNLVPRWIRVNANLGQFWRFIQQKYATYEDRKNFIRSELNPLLDYLKTKQTLPAAKTIDEVLLKFDSDSIHHAWKKALERKAQDPEGAITIARSILESVCKHILHKLEIEFNPNNIELSELYKLTANQLKLSRDQHSEKIFKQMLGGCSGIVNGLGSLRNKHGDAHGSNPKTTKLNQGMLN